MEASTPHRRRLHRRDPVEVALRLDPCGWLPAGSDVIELVVKAIVRATPFNGCDSDESRTNAVLHELLGHPKVDHRPPRDLSDVLLAMTEGWVADRGEATGVGLPTDQGRNRQRRGRRTVQTLAEEAIVQVHGSLPEAEAETMARAAADKFSANRRLIVRDFAERVERDARAKEIASAILKILGALDVGYDSDIISHTFEDYSDWDPGEAWLDWATGFATGG